MPYVSCTYALEDPTLDLRAVKGENARIVCTDENGIEWHLTEDSQVGDWLRFVEDGGTVDPAKEMTT